MFRKEERQKNRTWYRARIIEPTEYIADDIVNLEEEIEIHDNEDNLLYELAKLEELVTRHFTNVDENEGVKFSGIFEFDDELRKY